MIRCWRRCRCCSRIISRWWRSSRKIIRACTAACRWVIWCTILRTGGIRLWSVLMCRLRILKCFFRISPPVAKKQTRYFKFSRRWETSELELSWLKLLRANTRLDFAFWMTYYICCGYLTITVTLRSRLCFSLNNWTRTMISPFATMMTVVKASSTVKTRSKKHRVAFLRRSKVTVRSHLIIHRWECSSFRLVRSGQNYSLRAIAVPT
jgi:hypothetical protein